MQILTMTLKEGRKIYGKTVKIGATIDAAMVTEGQKINTLMLLNSNVIRKNKYIGYKYYSYYNAYHGGKHKTDTVSCFF